mgnify:CR=1 FL=1
MKINNQIKKYIYISLGAVPGVIFRWQIDQIFIVNMIGCFFIGLFNSLSFDSKYRLIFCIGFCGSLTTFSGWIFDLFILISDGFYIQTLLFTMLMLLMGLCAVCLGNLLAQKINRLF